MATYAMTVTVLAASQPPYPVATEKHMADLATLPSALQSTVDGESAALKTALENIVKLQVLKRRAVSSIHLIGRHQAPVSAVGMLG